MARVQQRDLDTAQEMEDRNFMKLESSDTIQDEPNFIPSQTVPPSSYLSPSRLALLVALLVAGVSLVHDTPALKEFPYAGAAQAGVIRAKTQSPSAQDPALLPRQTSNNDVCNRWSQQSALVNGTIYLYGGHVTTQQGQADHTWTNAFYSLDLTKGWDISSAPIQSLPQPSGPPAVSNGYLWNSYDSLYLYGGEFSDSPVETPSDYSLWEYNIKSSSWSNHQNPQTSAGNNSDPANQPIQRAAEGAGISVPGLGRGWYFAGHLDYLTTPGWSIQTPRVYLKALLEYTFPGASNDAVQGLGGGKTAGPDGAWRNITQAGIQDFASFPIRADSALVFVPGYGAQGILVSIAGGTNVSLTPNNIIDVFDIATSEWYKQSTSGDYPSPRVNPCAVAASAPDGSSTSVYMFGGQNLQPYKNQSQLSDTWVLTIPSFTWMEVDTTGQSVPPARAGHTCNIFNSQMVVVGGYNTELQGGCDNSVYVFSATNLTWQNNFIALSGSNAPNNTQNKQPVQAADQMALEGSYGYAVPNAVQKIVGGNSLGGATVTSPVQSATAGPFATGKPLTYPIPGTTANSSAGASQNSSSSNKGAKIGAIVAGVVAGLLAILAAYLGFCAWIYRRQLKLYKNHVAMTQRAAAQGGGPGEKAAFLGGSSKEGSSTGGGGVGGKNATDRSSDIPTGSTATNGYDRIPPGPVGGNSTANSSSEDLVGEPSFVGVLLSPRRSLRIVNR